MKKILVFIFALAFYMACEDDDNTMPPPQSFDYNESLSADLSGNFTAPDILPFVVGENTITATQSSTDVDYFTFTVPANSALSAIVVNDYQSADAAGFIGIVNGSVFSTNAANTASSDLLGGLVYGINNIGDNILLGIGSLDGAQGFSEALPSGNYTVWLNQTGDASEVTLSFLITSN